MVMGKGPGSTPRCEICGLHHALCLCAEVRPVEVPGSRLLIVQHHLESQKPTSTGPLACHLWKGSERVIFGRRGLPFDATALRAPDIEYRVLFPLAGAPRLLPPSGRPRVYVLLDATWSQASRMARRVPVVSALPFACLPDPPPSIWPIRRSFHDHQVCTLEAVIHLARLVAAPPEVQTLERALALLIERMLIQRGEVGTRRDPAP